LKAIPIHCQPRVIANCRLPIANFAALLNRGFSKLAIGNWQSAIT